MVNPFKVGFVFAIFLALRAGRRSAQKLIDFVFLHHAGVEPFDLVRAGILVGITAGVGLAGGFVGGAIWNAFHRG